MKTKRILTLVEDGLSITINLLTLEDQEFYFWFTGEFVEDIPKKGKGKLFPTFEELWEAFPFDPFLVFPEIQEPLPADLREFLRSGFLIKKELQEMNVFLVERWEEVLVSGESLVGSI